MNSSNENPTDTSHLCKTPEDCVDHYNNWADKYDSDVVDIEYRAPQLLVEICTKYIKNKNSKVLDFCCGTGEVARLLSVEGFSNIDGIDGSEKMLEHCRRDRIYKNLFQEILQPGRPSKVLENGSYDAIIAVGVFSPGHMNGDFLNHLYEPVKKNGLTIVGIREPWVKELDMEAKFEKLETDCIWRLVARETKPNYRQSVPGIFYVFECL